MRLILLVAGDNYGWPLVSHGFEYGTEDKVSEHDSLSGFNDPEWVWIPSIAPSGMDFYPIASDVEDDVSRSSREVFWWAP